MADFHGYHTILRNPRFPGLPGDHRDLRFMAQQHDPLSAAGIEPMCPLAAVGRTLLDMSRVEIDAFYNGTLVIDVIDVARRTVETYDIEKHDFELELERIAG